MDLSRIVSIIKTTSRGNESVGTGFFIGEHGLVLTCYHVLENAGCYNVGSQVSFMFEGQARVMVASLLDFDKELDIAIIYTSIEQFMGYWFSSNNRTLDHTFVTLGFPEGSLSGVVAHPTFERESPDGFIELKNANDVCQGFSGAPLINESGLVSGVIRIIPKSLRREGSMLNVTRAIPIRTVVKRFADKLSDLQQYTFDQAIRPTALGNTYQRIFNSDSNENVQNRVHSKKFTDFYEKRQLNIKEITHDKQDVDNIAKKTFVNMIHVWLDKTEANAPHYFQLDWQNIDFLVYLPSMHHKMDAIQTFWKVYSTTHRLERFKRTGSDIGYFRLSLSKETISSLKEISNQHKNFYFAFAYNPVHVEPSELWQITPLERFEWYCVDLGQLFSNNEQIDYIEIPDCNILNLSTFSLLWSSLWVNKFYEPLCSPASIELPHLMDVIRLTHPYQNEQLLKLEDWTSLNKKLSVCERELGKNEYAKLHFPLGIGYFLEVIKKKLYDAGADLNMIQNYCPESLYGTANLWLFSRSYHGFMTMSGQVVPIGRKHNNLRILPLPDNPKNISKLVKVCLWHIVLLYSSLNVEVRIVYRPSLYAGTDHSYYGGGIGYFPWLSLSDDNVTWIIENNIDATNGQHRDFINEHMNNLYINPYHSNLWEVANELDLHINDIRTAPRCPINLFPKETRFIEYPLFIFGSLALRSLNSVKLKLL